MRKKFSAKFPTRSSPALRDIYNMDYCISSVDGIGNEFQKADYQSRGTRDFATPRFRGVPPWTPFPKTLVCLRRSDKLAIDRISRNGLPRNAGRPVLPEFLSVGITLRVSVPVKSPFLFRLFSRITYKNKPNAYCKNYIHCVKAGEKQFVSLTKSVT